MLCHNRSNDQNKKSEPNIKKENFSMNEHINNLRNKLCKKVEPFITEFAKYKTVNCRNVHVTKEKNILQNTVQKVIDIRKDYKK